MTIDEIRFRRLAGQHLLAPVDAQTAARDLCGLQAQFLSNAFHALRIRSADFNADRPDGFMKNWTLRGTMHLFYEHDLPLMLHCGRQHALRPCDTLEADEYVTAERKRFFADVMMKHVHRGTCARDDLKQICFDAGMTDVEARSIFNPWGGTIRALCEEGKLTHAVSSKKAFAPCPPFVPHKKEQAQLELARRYFTHYGPATIRDSAYFLGYTQAEIKRLLLQLPVRETQCGAKIYYYIEETAPEYADMPPCIFLAGFDPLMLGYEKRENPFLPQTYLREIFNLAGIVMPALLVHGRVVGKWKRTGRKLAITLFEAIDAANQTAILHEAECLWPNLTSIDVI